MKNQRVFWMQVQGASQTWTFQSPLSLEVNITRAAFNSLADGVFRIYNLSESIRRDIYQDWYNLGPESYHQIKIRAGYRSWTTVYGPPDPAGIQNLESLPLIFQGNITKAYSQREGSNWVTTINAWDGGHAVTQGDTNTTVSPGISLADQFRTLINEMGPTVSVGFIDETLEAVYLRGVSLVGSPWNKITQLANSVYASAFIDLEQVYIVGNGNVIPNLTGGLDIISPATGLLDTPMKQNTQLSFDMIFEPRLKVGQQIILQSIETVTNGSYPIVGIDHTGMISDAVAGDMRTRVYCYFTHALIPYGAIQ